MKTILKNKRFAHWSFCLVATVFIVLMQVSMTTSATTEVKGPGWFLERAEPVSLKESKAYYQAASSKKVKALGAFSTAGGIRTVSSSLSTTITPEIAELGRALNHDPKLIYDYVHNHIDYVPYFGSLKGATLTLLDGSGNDFDQVSLMIALLRASGYTANFVHGAMLSMPLSFVANWLEVDEDMSVARSVLGCGGIPAYLWDDGSSVKANIYRVWVKATIDGTDYVFDPAYKQYTYTSKIDIESSTGYNRTDFLNAVTSGASINSDSVQSLNQVNLNNKLSEYTANLISILRTQYSNSDVRDIIGGRQIIQEHLTKYSTSLLHNTNVIYEWTEVPANYTATLRVQHNGIDHTLEIPEIAGKRLTMTYAGSSLIPELRLDGTVIATGTSTTRGNKYDMIISIDHPYAAYDGTYCDQTATWKCISGSTYAIVSDFGGTTDNLILKRQKCLSQGFASGLADTSEQVLGETLNIMGLTWLKERLLADRLLDKLAETVSIWHHKVGVMAQEAGYYIDAKTGMVNIISRHDIAADKVSNFYAGAIGSAFEHAILEQLMGSDNPGVSTIKLMHIANNQGSKVFWAHSGNFASIQPQLRNYSTSTLNDIQSAINSGETVILPDNGKLGINQWQGTGYASKYSADGSMSLGMIISGGYFGGYGSIPGSIDPLPVYDDIRIVLPDISYNLEIPTPSSAEPVDMASGAYLYDRTDIALGGSAPMGLGFSRSYNSSRNMDKRSMGYGWQQNYDIFLSRVSDGNPGLGLRTPVDAAAMITNLYIALDLMRNEDNIKGWMVMFLAHKWAVDQLIDNAISVNIGGQVTEYIKLPDDSYNNPPGITTKLVDNGNGTFSLKERFGTQMDFDTSDHITQLWDIDGNTLSFTYTGNKLTRVQDTVGRSLTLNYTGDNIASAMDSEGRSVSYTYDNNNNLVSFIDVAGKTWRYGYDSQHQMASLINPLEVTTATNTYDALGRVKTQAVPRDGTITTYNFYFSRFRNVEENPYGKQTVYYLDKKGRTYAVEDALLNRTIKTFDGQNHVVSIKNSREYTTAFTYDGNHNLTKITDALDKKTNNTYDRQFRLTDTTDPLNHTTHFDYDSKHHLTQTTDAENNTTSLTYYPNGKTETTTDGRDTVTTLSYDSNNHPFSTKTASHPAITYDYDRIGRMRSLTDQEGATTSFNYDNHGLLLTRTDPLGKTISFIYDDAGRLISRTDRNDNTTTYTYTPSDKLKTITYPDGSTVTFTYDLHDKLVNMQDTIGTTTYTYDNIYRLKSVTNPYGQVVSYEYDQVGNVTKIIYPDNKVVTYSYDELNRLKTVTNWLSQNATYDYDDAGRLASVTNFNGTVTVYTYDDANRLVSLKNKTSSTGAILSKYAYTLDGNGNRTQVIQTEPLPPIIPTSNIDFSYNLTKNRLFGAGSAPFTDSSTVNPKTVTAHGNARIDTTQSKFGSSSAFFDGEGDYLSIADSDDWNFASADFTIDFWVKFNTLPVSGGNNTFCVQYQDYDNFLWCWLNNSGTEYRLAFTIKSEGTYPCYIRTPVFLDSNAWYHIAIVRNGDDFNLYLNGTLMGSDTNSGSMPNFSAAFEIGRGIYQAYFLNGWLDEFRISKGMARWTSNFTPPTEPFDADTRTALMLHCNGVGSSTNFTYDEEGQLATKDSTSYNFDYEHRLKDISGANSEQFLYDGKGNRLQATRNGIVTRYIYDASGKLLAETDNNNTITRYYIYDRGLLAMVTPQGQTYTYHYNGIGSTIVMTDQNKNVVNRYFYSPFGLITNTEENLPQPFKYAGKYGIMYEPNGLYYMRARYYDPEVGRFISEDPLGFDGGVNLYTYVKNNPINYIDPWGLDTYYINNEFFSSTPTDNPISHSFVATTDINPITGKEVVTDTYSWTNENGGSWHHNDPQNRLGAQVAINSGVGIQRYGDESLDKFVATDFQNRQNDTGRYWNWLGDRGNCKEMSGQLLSDAIDRQYQETNK